MATPLIHPVDQPDDQPDESTNLLRTLAHSPAVLRIVRSFFDNAPRMTLSPRTQLAVALRVAQLHACGYCVAAHSAAASSVDVDATTARDFRSGVSSRSQESLLLGLTTKIVRDRGQHARMIVDAARELGVSDAALVETVALTAMHTLLTYMSSVAATELDFPDADAIS